jgi:hypothetical protein
MPSTVGAAGPCERGRSCEKVAADPEYLGRLPATKDLSTQDSRHVAQLTRIA